MARPQHIVDLLLQGITDFHRTNMFEVVLNPPQITELDGDKEAVILAADMIKQISWPGVSIPEIPIKRMGLTVNIPAAIGFNGKVAMSLRDDEQSRIRMFFVNWQKHHYGEIQTGIYNPNLKELIKGTVDIYQLDSQHERTTQTTLYNSWPSEIGDLDLNHESDDTVLDFNVQMVYSYAKQRNNPPFSGGA